MSHLKLFKFAGCSHDKDSPTTAWASMVAMLAAENKKAELDKKVELESRQRRKQQAA